MDGIQNILQKAAECGDKDGLYAVIGQCPNILKQMEDMEFVHSPLHAAAIANQIDFAMEVAMLKPSLSRKLNLQGYTPMHLALQYGNFEVARRLLAIDPQLVRVKGRDGFTPLHYAAQIGEAELVEAFLSACLSSIKDLTSHCQTVVHIAAASNSDTHKSMKTCRVLLKWLNSVERQEKEEILTSKDAGGNTILHVAASANNLEAVKLFIGCAKVNTKNLQDQTALDLIVNADDETTTTATTNNREGVRKILEREERKQVKLAAAAAIYKNMIKGWLSSKLPCFPRRQEKTMISAGRLERHQSKANEIRNIILVVATLIANATYQAVLSPPGGYWQDNATPKTPSSGNNNATVTAPPPPAPSQVSWFSYSSAEKHLAGQMILTGQTQAVFLLANTCCFYLSLLLILILTAGMPFASLIALMCACLSATYVTALFNGIYPYDGVLIFLIPMGMLLCYLPKWYVHWFNKSEQLQAFLIRPNW